jgi:EmrB/QacA subfamily drug resistance transporter
MSTTSIQPVPEAPQSGATRPRGRALVLVMVSLLLTLAPLQLDGLVAATAVPTIVGDLGGFSRIAWVATAYLLTMAIGTILAGRIGDMVGRKPLHLVAVSVFFAGSAWAGLSTEMTEFILARAVQGLGAGMALTTLMAIVADIAPPAERAKYQGMLAAVAPVSMIAGPALGGVVTDHMGWRWIFLLNLPLIAVALLVAATVLRLPGGTSRGRVDVAGAVLASLGSARVVLAATWGGGQYSWGSPQVLLAGAIGVAAFLALVFVERRAEHPVLPPGLFGNRTVLMCLVIMFCGVGAVMMVGSNFVPVFQQLVQHQSASSSGLLLLPMLLPAILLAVISGQYLSRTARFRLVLVLGTAALSAGCALLATMGPATPIWLTACYLAVVGSGLGLLFQTPMVLVQNSAPVGQVGAATGTASFLRMLGGALGVGALGALFTSVVRSSVASASVPGLDASTVSSLTPDQLAGLPPNAVTALGQAVSSGTSALFWVALVLGLVALAAAVCVPGRR